MISLGYFHELAFHQTIKFLPKSDLCARTRPVAVPPPDTVRGLPPLGNPVAVCFVFPGIVDYPPHTPRFPLYCQCDCPSMRTVPAPNVM